MAHKRKIDYISCVEESEKIMFSNFLKTANHLSQFYAQSFNHQKLVFDAGQKHSLVKLHEWMESKLQDGKQVSVPEILDYVQSILNNPVLGHGLPDGSEQNQSELAASSSATVTHGLESCPEITMETSCDEEIN